MRRKKTNNGKKRKKEERKREREKQQLTFRENEYKWYRKTKQSESAISVVYLYAKCIDSFVYLDAFISFYFLFNRTSRVNQYSMDTYLQYITLSLRVSTNE